MLAANRRSAHVLFAAIGLSGCTPNNSPPPRNPSSPLIVEPISLGIVAPGGTASGCLTLKNEANDAITLARVDASCPCVRISSLPIRVEGRSEQSLPVAFDPEAEPDFRGGLSVGLTGHGPDGAVLFESRVDLDVRAAVAGGSPR